jgi:hypothetical protein
MALEVRSDFDVSLVVRQPDGSLRSLGKHHGKTSHEEHGEETAARVVPHLHRVSPDGRWLASFDADDRAVYVAGIGAERVSRGQRLRIEGLDFEPGELSQFRWFASDPFAVDLDGDASGDPGGFIFSTPSTIRWAPLADDSITQGGTVRAEPVFTGVDARPKGERTIHDTRVVPGGFMVRSSSGYGGDVHFVRVSDGAIQEVSSLLPRGIGTSAANVALDGRIVVSAYAKHYEEMEQGILPLKAEHELWTYTVDAHEARFERALDCPDEYCWITNWAPGSSPLVVAMEGAMIGVTTDEGKTHSFEFAGDEGYWGSVHALWSHGDTILAANDQAVRSFALDGEVRWTWEAPEDQEITGVHEDHDGSALVSVGRTLMRVTDGKAKRVLRVRGRWGKREYDEGTDFGGYRHSFIDQALPLANGAIAYTVVDLHATYHEIEWEEMLSPEELEELEALEDASSDPMVHED